MKKFDFSLQKVLDLREFEESGAKMALAAAVADVARLNRELEEIARSRVAAHNARSGVSDIQQLVAAGNYITGLDMRKEELLEELAQAELVLEQKKQLVAEAMKNRKVLEKLKDKKRAGYRKQSLKDEENAVDDIVTSRYT